MAGSDGSPPGPATLAEPEDSVAAAEDPVEAIAARFPVADRPTWLAIAGIALLLLAGIGWAVFGRAPDTVIGHGMVIPQQGFFEVGTSLEGTVVSVAVAPGDTVDQGSDVAHIRIQSGAEVTVRAPIAGTVATVLVRAGGITERGTALMTIEPTDAEQVVAAFVPAGPGKRIEVGMRATVAPDSVARSQYGMIEGRVEAVSPVPVSPERVILIVGGNTSLTDFFLAQGPVLEVTISLKHDPSTPSGYDWTTGAGPPTRLTSGTLAEVNVYISVVAPIQRILG